MLITELTKKYSEPHRKYHNMSHIAHCFESATKLEFAFSNELVLAIWGHDAIYVPGAENNEEESVKFTQDILGAGQLDNWNDIRTAIMDTKLHIPHCNLSNYLIDVDLAILGSFAHDEYTRYKRSLVEEYMPLIKERGESFATDLRIKWLENMLGREYVFCTTKGREIFERQARINLANELLDLYEGVRLVQSKLLQEQLK